MEFEIVYIFDLIMGIFCLIAGFYLLMNAIKSQKKVLISFSVYFLAVSLSLFLIFIYVAFPSLSVTYGHFIVFLAILIASLGVLALLLGTYYINSTLSRPITIFELFLTVMLLFLILILYPVNVGSLGNQGQNLTIFYSLLLFVAYLIPYIFCILNLLGLNVNTSGYTKSTVRNLIIFFSLSIVLTFGKITSFFTIDINNTAFNFSFMDSLVVLLLIQIFLVVYSIPINSEKKFMLKISNR